MFLIFSFQVFAQADDNESEQIEVEILGMEEVSCSSSNTPTELVMGGSVDLTEANDTSEPNIRGLMTSSATTDYDRCVYVYFGIENIASGTTYYNVNIAGGLYRPDGKRVANWQGEPTNPSLDAPQLEYWGEMRYARFTTLSPGSNGPFYTDTFFIPANAHIGEYTIAVGVWNDCSDDGSDNDGCVGVAGHSLGSDPDFGSFEVVKVDSDDDGLDDHCEWDCRNTACMYLPGIEDCTNNCDDDCDGLTDEDDTGDCQACQGTDQSCGTTNNCVNCNNDDDCYAYGNGCEYRDYYCNGASCAHTYSNRNTDGWTGASCVGDILRSEYRDYGCSQYLCTYQVTDNDDDDCTDDNGCYSGTYRDYTCSVDSCTYSTVVTDDDNDGYDIECDNDCDDSDSVVYPGATEQCNGLDDDCDGSTPANEADSDGDGYRICGGDCDDTDSTVYTGHLEICDDGLDNDCDDKVDNADPDCAPGPTPTIRVNPISLTFEIG